jgi:hypothetical protein
MNSSNLHADAARRNGKLSQGPVTPEGKQRSSQNARKHNFFTNIALLPDEDQDEFNALLADFTEEHKPTTPTERRYVREMADAELRLRRVRDYAARLQCSQIDMNNLTHNPMADAFQKLAENSNTLQLCLRYERHFQRQFDSALKMLFTLRKNQPREQHPAEDSNSDLAFRVKVLERYIYGLPIDDAPEDFEDDIEDGEPTLQNEPSNGPPNLDIRL